MSSNGNGDGDDQGGAGRREVAWRVFAAEYDDSDFDYSESDEERAPNYVVTPTGARVNRLFVVGVLTEVEAVSDDVLRGRVVDPTGAFVLYAGQYQPDEMAFLENASPPAFVAVTGKARTFQPDDSDRVFTSIRPESINRVDADTRDRWVVQTAEQTLSRVSTAADAIDSGERGDALRMALEKNGVDAGLAAGIPLALDHYGTTKAYLAEMWDLAVDSARVVAGELAADDVGPLELAPGEGGDDAAVDFDYALPDATGEVSDLDTETDSEPTSTTAEASDETVDVSESTTESSQETAEKSDTDLGETPESETAAEADDGLGETPATDDTPTETAADDESTGDSGLGDAPTGTAEESPADAEESPVEPEDHAVEDAAERSSASRSTEHDTVEDADDAAELQDDIGTDEPPTVADEQETSTDDEFAPETEDDGPDIGSAGAGDEMYEFDDDEREEVEAEYGLEFSSGSEVESPEESDLDAPDPEAGLDNEAEAEPEAGTGESDGGDLGDFGGGSDEESPSDTPEAAESTDEGGADTAEEPATETADAAAEADDGEQEAPANLEDTVMTEMRELNDGDGVERDALLASVVQDYDVTPADVDDALEAALMAGRCYESGEDTLKPI